MEKPVWQSLTVLGAALWGAAQAAKPHLPARYQTAIDIVGTLGGPVLTAVGVRKAIAKNGKGK